MSWESAVWSALWSALTGEMLLNTASKASSTITVLHAGSLSSGASRLLLLSLFSLLRRYIFGTQWVSNLKRKAQKKKSKKQQNEVFVPFSISLMKEAKREIPASQSECFDVIRAQWASRSYFSSIFIMEKKGARVKVKEEIRLRQVTVREI